MTNMDSASRRGAADVDHDDACFYNSLCSHFMFGFPDFNHIFSNVASCALGALLVLITLLKRCLDAPGQNLLYLHEVQSVMTLVKLIWSLITSYYYS